MSDDELRWSALESRTPMARPLGLILRDDGAPPRGLTLTGPDLLFRGAFRAAVLEMLGELLEDPDIDGAPDPQLAWLDRLAGLLPAGEIEAVEPVDHQDPHYGMQYRFAVQLCDSGQDPPALVDAGTLLDYQLLQATLAHQTGRLWRRPDIEAVADPSARRAAWAAALRPLLRPPA